MDSSFKRFSQRETTSHLSNDFSISQGRLGLKSVKYDNITNSISNSENNINRHSKKIPNYLSRLPHPNTKYQLTAEHAQYQESSKSYRESLIDSTENNNTYESRHNRLHTCKLLYEQIMKAISHEKIVSKQQDEQILGLVQRIGIKIQAYEEPRSTDEKTYNDIIKGFRRLFEKVYSISLISKNSKEHISCFNKLFDKYNQNIKKAFKSGNLTMPDVEFKKMGQKYIEAVYKAISESESHSPLEAASSRSTLSQSTLPGETTGGEASGDKGWSDDKIETTWDALRKVVFNSSVDDKSHSPLEAGSSSSILSQSTLPRETTSGGVGHCLTDRLTGNQPSSWAKAQRMITEDAKNDKTLKEQQGNRERKIKQFQHSPTKGYKTLASSHSVVRRSKNTTINRYRNATFEVELHYPVDVLKQRTILSTNESVSTSCTTFGMKNIINKIFKVECDDTPKFHIQWDDRKPKGRRR